MPDARQKSSPRRKKTTHRPGAGVREKSISRPCGVGAPECSYRRCASEVSRDFARGYGTFAKSRRRERKNLYTHLYKLIHARIYAWTVFRACMWASRKREVDKYLEEYVGARERE